MRSKLKIMLSSIIFLCLSACSVVQQVIVDPTVETPPGSILFLDDFSSNKNGWKTWNDDGSSIVFEGDGLHFFIGKPNYDFLSRPGYRYSNVIVEVDAIKLEGPDNNAFGVICRLVDEKNYYAFVISSDGYAGILKVKDGVYQLLNNNTLDYYPSIHQSDALNTISGECNDNKLILKINGEKAIELTDSDFILGDVGLMAGSYNEPGVDILFDNLTVYQP